MAKSEPSRDICIAGVILFIFDNLMGRNPNNGQKANSGENDINGKNDKIGTDGRNGTNEYRFIEPPSHFTNFFASQSMFFFFFEKNSRTDTRECRARDGGWRQNTSLYAPTHMRWLKMSWAFESAFSQKSSCRHVFHRNLLGVPDPPLFLTTLVTESGTTCADPLGGSLFGRRAEQIPFHVMSQKTWSISPASTRRLPSLQGRTASPPTSMTFPPLLRLTSQKPLKQDSWLHHCSRRSEK